MLHPAGRAASGLADGGGEHGTGSRPQAANQTRPVRERGSGT